MGYIEDVYTASVLELDAKIVVELGTGRGQSLRAFLEGLKQTKGQLYSVDRYPMKDDVKPTIDLFRSNPYVKFVTGNSVTVGQNWTHKIDILLCDSAHSKEHVLKELESWMKFEPKLAFIHDTRNPKLEKDGPYYGAEQYAKQKGIFFEEIITDFPGLGLITESKEMIGLVKSIIKNL
jgi:cephalosporin hydroxylase